MSHWLVRSILTLLCLFGTGLTVAWADDTGLRSASLAQALAVSDRETHAVPASALPEPTDSPAEDAALLEAMLERSDVKSDGTALDNVDLANSLTFGRLAPDAHGTPDGREGLSLPTPYLSKLRRPPRG